MGVRKKKRVPWGWIWTGVLVAGAGGYGVWYRQETLKNAAKLPQGVQVGRVERGDLSQKITASGVVAAQTGAKVNIGSQITGRIRSLPADVGAPVRAGQVVAELDAPDLQAQVEQQRQNVAVAEANLASADSRLRQAELNWQLSGEQSRAQISEADSALNAAGERLQSAEAAAKMQPAQTASEVARAEAALSTAQSQERQVRQTVNLQLAQSQNSIDEIRALVDNTARTLRRQETLLQQGFVARQEVDDTRTSYRQASARLKNAEASLNILKEKTAADLQAAKDQVLQAQATLEAARAGRLQDTMRAAEERGARAAVRQSEATLALRRSSRTETIIRKRAVEEARSSLAQARASLRQSRALLKYQEAQLDKTLIRSPINGTVLTISTQQGETIAAGFSAPTLITVADLRRLEVRAYVDEVDVGRVRIGLPAEVRVESYQGRVFRGRVAKIASASTVKDNVVTYETTIALENAAGLLRPDMTADVTLVLGTRPGVLLVPTEAVHREVRRTITYVLHREKQGKERVETREIRIGIDDGTHTEVTSGLREEEEVVLAGLPRLGVKAADAQDADRKKDK